MAYWRTGALGALGALGAILYILPCHFSEVDVSGVARHLEECGYCDAFAVALQATVVSVACLPLAVRFTRAPLSGGDAYCLVYFI